ncbi:MAG: EpsG family protein [Oceanospirillaceae bacterium]|nr:EpsG family protein [Oceanospirillaceae bacterium]
MINIKKSVLVGHYICFLIIFSFATIISSYLSLDSKTYQRIFFNYSSTPWSNLWVEIRDYEMFFLILAKLLNGWPCIVWFGLIAFFSVSLKLSLIAKGSRHFYLSLLLYLSYFFVLQDGTGIRVSLAIAIAFWGAFFLSNGHRKKALLIIICSGLFIHYSLLVFFVVFFLSNKKITLILIFSWPISIFLWWLGVDIINMLNMFLSNIESDWFGLVKLKSYVSRNYEVPSPYSSQFIVLYFLSIAIFFRYKKELNNFEVICFNCVFLSIFVLGLLVGAGALQNRLSEIFRFGLVFVFPLYYRYCLEWVYKPWIANLITAGFLIGYFYYYVLRAGLIIWPENWGHF